MMTRIGGFWLSMVRICTGEVWVRSNSREPSGFSGKKNVSCMSRAGWLAGKLSKVKLYASVSMSGPSATANPMSAKIAVSSSFTCVNGCTRPTSAGGSRTGRVTSTVSVLSRASSACALSSSLRAAIAVLTSSFSPWMSGPCCLRSSGLIVPSLFSNSEIAPFLPSAETRTLSSAASSAAAATAARIRASSWRRSDVRSDMISDLGLLDPAGGCDCPQRMPSSPRALRCGSEAPARSAPAGQRGFRLAHDRLERRRLANGEIGQHLAIDHDPGLAEAGDKSAVRQPERAHRRIEPLDPQRAKRALFALAIAIGVLLRALDRLLGDPNGILAAAVIALGGFQNFLVLGMRGDASLDAGHGSLHRKSAVQP